jgi:hypothetical protein
LNAKFVCLLIFLYRRSLRLRSGIIGYGSGIRFPSLPYRRTEDILQRFEFIL